MAARRGRPPKAKPQILEPEEIDDDLSVDPPEEVEQTPMMKVVERREYIRPMDDTVGGVTIDTEPGEFIDDSDAAFSDFMSEADGQVRMLRVYKLKDTFRPGTQPYMSAQGSFCDEIPLTSDWLKVIKFNWGQSGGYFRVQLIDPAYPGRFKKHKLVHIEAPGYVSPVPGINTPPTAGPPQYTFNYPAPGAPPVDPMKQMRDQMSLVRDYAQMMKEFVPATSTALAPVDPNQAPAIVELKTRMEMFEKLAGLSPEKQAPLIQLVKGLGLMGDVDEGSGDRWLRLLEGLTPVINAGLGLLMARFMPPGGPPPGQPAMPPVAGQLAAPAPPQPVANPADAILLQAVEQIIFGINSGGTYYTVEAMFTTLYEQFPNSSAVEQAGLILNKPPAEVVAQLRLGHPDAERWIKGLQDYWREENTAAPGGPPDEIVFGGGGQ